jgi:tellurite resistance-related uncharacterized protein
MTTGSTFISVYASTIDNYSPLLTVFQMVKYPSYTMDVDVEEKKSVLFHDREHFLQWEAVTEIRAMLEEVAFSIAFLLLL